jgi:hypothetical protein
MFDKKIAFAEDQPHKPEAARFLLDQMLDERRVADAVSEVIRQFDQALDMKKQMLDNLLTR